MTTTYSCDDANTVKLPAPTPKPTSLDGQLETSLDIWTSLDGGFETGVWECAPGHFTATRDGYDEVATILSGTATVVDANGVTTKLRAGSVFVTPAGWSGTWTVHESLRKVYAIRTVST